MADEIKCKCKRCKHRWTYKGKKTEVAEQTKFPVYVSCPQCKTTMRLEVKK